MLKFELQSSRYLAFLLLILYGGAITILISLTLPWWLKIGLILLCLASLDRQRRESQDIIGIRYSASENWQLQDKHGQVWTVRLCGDSVCTLYFVLLNFKLVGQRGRRSVMIFPDSLASTDLRRLRVFLKS